jgi:hypothetical protein
MISPSMNLVVAARMIFLPFALGQWLLACSIKFGSETVLVCERLDCAGTGINKAL